MQRGIDPHVDDQSHCHVSARFLMVVCRTLTAFQNHSEVPERDEDWPTLSEIVRYRDRVRERVFDLYRELESGKRILTRRLARTLVMVLEHDAFHIEVRSCRYCPGISVDFCSDAVVYDHSESGFGLLWSPATPRHPCTSVG